jgi:GTP-binding protein
VITARDGIGVRATIDLARVLFKQAQTRVSTGTLNKVLAAAVQVRSGRPRRGHGSVRVYYGSQVAVNPPTIVLFVNDPSLIRDDYRRFLLNRLRESLPFAEIPIRFLFRSHHRGDGEGPPAAKGARAGPARRRKSTAKRGADE